MLDVDLDEPVVELKSRIQERLEIPIRRQRLKTLQGRMLQDSHTPEEYGIQEHATLQLSVEAPSRRNAPLENISAFSQCAAKGALENTTRIARCVAGGSSTQMREVTRRRCSCPLGLWRPLGQPRNYSKLCVV